MNTTPQSAGVNSRRARLEEEICYMEARLEEIGFEGDCAYERAMSRFYREQIASRRKQLAGGLDEVQYSDRSGSAINRSESSSG